MQHRSAAEAPAAPAAPPTGYAGPGAGSYARRRKGRQADVYDRPAIERAATGDRGQARHKRGRPRPGEEQ